MSEQQENYALCDDLTREEAEFVFRALGEYRVQVEWFNPHGIVHREHWTRPLWWQPNEARDGRGRVDTGTYESAHPACVHGACEMALFLCRALGLKADAVPSAFGPTPELTPEERDREVKQFEEQLQKIKERYKGK